MAKILVTGGAGFIGSHVGDHYIEAGHDVVALDNLATGDRRNVNPKARFVEMDICDSGMAAFFAAEGFDYVNHLAAQIDVRKSVTDPQFDATVNILGTINLLEAARQHGVQKFLFASTGGAIYGEPEELPASEQCRPNPKCHYAASKLAAEYYIQLYRNLYDLSYTILRFPNVYGPRQNPEGEAGVCSILSRLMLEGQQPTLYGHGEPLRDYVFVGDIARGCTLALEQGENRILNLGSGQGASVQQVYDILKAAIGYTGDAALAPLRAGEIQNSYITGDQAKEVLGWQPEVTLENGLQQTAEFIREQWLAGEKI